jgi:hypothetical protein
MSQIQPNNWRAVDEGKLDEPAFVLMTKRRIDNSLIEVTYLPVPHCMDLLSRILSTVPLVRASLMKIKPSLSDLKCFVEELSKLELLALDLLLCSQRMQLRQIWLL